MKVLHVVGKMEYGGTETLLMNLLRSADRKKVQYDFVEQTREECAYDREILSLGSKIYRCPHISYNNLRKYRKWWRDFYREHPEYQIIHGHSRGSAPIYLDEAKKAGRITILHCHSGSYGTGVRGLLRHLWQLPLYHISSHRFACSNDAGISQFGKNSSFHVVKNGIYTERYVFNPSVRDRIRKEYNIGDSFVVGNVSRLDDPKNHEFLVEIFCSILKERENSMLMIVGSGWKEGKIRKLVRDKGIEDRVIFTGARNNVNEILQAMDAFVFPSLYEGLPLALIEAQAAGLPTFTSDKVVAPEVKITDLLWFISLGKTAGEWSRFILDHVSDAADRRDMSADIVSAGFDIQTTQDWLCDFYYRVLQDAGK